MMNKVKLPPSGGLDSRRAAVRSKTMSCVVKSLLLLDFLGGGGRFCLIYQLIKTKILTLSHFSDSVFTNSPPFSHLIWCYLRAFRPVLAAAFSAFGAGLSAFSFVFNPAVFTPAVFTPANFTPSKRLSISCVPGHTPCAAGPVAAWQGLKLPCAAALFCREAAGAASAKPLSQAGLHQKKFMTAPGGERSALLTVLVRARFSPGKRW